ncbi:MAG TPA: 1-acyl-sn-glycerol-3-phosphate acyltransferase [Bacteroidales bacterium]|nr:1-acyl-sn-glycerol-3-phosphate acyltransferase [Bacteroidales bacterium]
MFDEIRAYSDQELLPALHRLWEDQEFRAVVAAVPFIGSIGELEQASLQCTSVKQLHKTIIHKLLSQLADKTCASLQSEGFESLDPDKAYIYMSNHRDIVLDSSFLNVILLNHGLDSCETGIGDNLLIRPWIRDFVRANKSFVVKRNLSVREQLLATADLSAYISHTLQEKKQSIWLAQREGRAKDSDDRTQKSILKMLIFGEKGNILEKLASMHLIPLSISYEFDPCDYLKAKEMQLKRDQSDYKKSREDDLLSMKTGIMGYKGRVFYRAGACISEEIIKMDAAMPKKDLIEKIADLMDLSIHANYRLYPNNYIAADLLDEADTFVRSYSRNEREKFTEYLQQQLDKIELPCKDEPFLRRRMLEMYANPLKNKHKAKASKL